MDTANDARFVMRHGAIQLTIAMLLGIPLVAQAPRSRQWMGLHVTVMVGSLVGLVTALLWSHLRLGAKAQAALKWLSVGNGYLGIALGSAATLLGLPGPVTGTGQPFDASLMAAFGPGFGILGLTGIAWAALLAFGLRGKAT